MSGDVRHLYVHLPFCVHRCGYCDFVTLVGRAHQHEPYATALLTELELEGPALARRLETVFVGGGTPTFMAPHALARVLAALPHADEVTVEANPETVTPALAALLREHGVNRVSLGAQSFRPHLLAVLERAAEPATVVRAFATLRDAGFDNISLDLIYGIPGQTAADLDTDVDDALALGPDHLSWYELEAKPGTRFTHTHGAALERQADAMEDYFERVIDRLTTSGYRWYETANFCRSEEVAGRDLRAQHNLAYWRGRDYLGVGIGAVSTVGGRRWRNTVRLSEYLAAGASRVRPRRDVEPLPADIQARERVMLGLRLDEPLPVRGLEPVLDSGALTRLAALGLTDVQGSGEQSTIALTARGRMLGGGVTAELLA